MDLNALRLFVAAAQAGSLSEGARRTSVPLPTLSRRVRKLEDELGVRLVERGARGLALTPAGTRLIADAEPALASLSQAEQRLSSEDGVAGVLRVSIPPNFQPLWTVLTRFGERYAAVRFDVFVTDRRVDLVADGIDVAIRVGEEALSSYVGRSLTRYRHQLVASPNLLAHHPIEAPEDLQSVPCVCWRTVGQPVWFLGGRELAIEPRLASNDYLHLLHLAMSGKAVTELPPFLAARPIEEQSLVPILQDYPMPERHVRALVVEKRAMSPLVRQFLDFAVEQVPNVVTHAASLT